MGAGARRRVRRERRSSSYLLGPFAEELFFRGLGVRVLMLYGGLVAILVTGVIFGLVHGMLGALPPLVLFGIGLAWVRLRSASVWPAFIGHAAYNGLGVLVLVISWTVELLTAYSWSHAAERP